MERKKTTVYVEPDLLRAAKVEAARTGKREYEVFEDVRMILRGAKLVQDPPAPPRLTPDPDDDYLMALASAAGARFLVSGDAHLTQLVEPVPPVLTPRAFLDGLEGSEGRGL